MIWNDYSKVKPSEMDLGKKFLISDGEKMKFCHYIIDRFYQENHMEEMLIPMQYYFKQNIFFQITVKYWIGPLEFPNEL